MTRGRLLVRDRKMVDRLVVVMDVGPSSSSPAVSVKDRSRWMDRDVRAGSGEAGNGAAGGGLAATMVMVIEKKRRENNPMC